MQYPKLKIDPLWSDYEYALAWDKYVRELDLYYLEQVSGVHAFWQEVLKGENKDEKISKCKSN